MMAFRGVLEMCAFCHHEYVAKNNHVFDLGLFSCAPGVYKSLCFTMCFHDFVNALVKLVLCISEWSLTFLPWYLQWFETVEAKSCFKKHVLRCRDVLYFTMNSVVSDDLQIFR